MFGPVVPWVPRCYLWCNISEGKGSRSSSTPIVLVSLEPRFQSSLQLLFIFYFFQKEREREKMYELYNRGKSSSIFLKFSFSIIIRFFLRILCLVTNDFNKPIVLVKLFRKQFWWLHIIFWVITFKVHRVKFW